MKKILTILFLLSFNTIFAQSYIEFTENKGQWDNNILYNGNINNGQFALTTTGYKVLKYDAVQLANYEKEAHANATKSHVVNGQVWNVNFLQANTKPQIVSNKQLPGIDNYFIGNDAAKWGTDCKSFTEVSYKNIYDNIDVNYYSSNGTLKYDVIVHPNADASKIKIQYDGVNKIRKDKYGSLLVETSIGAFKELSPYTYQIINNQKKVIECNYKLKDNTLSFELGNYDKNATLIIDPTLIFSTHSGSTVDNWGFTATYGPDETFYGGGDVRGTGFPVSSGAFQTNFNNGTTDIGIIKLSANGSTKVYVTYIGGSGAEQPQSLICDPQGNLIIAGRTSSTNFPATVTLGTKGGFDIFLFKLNTTGTALIGSMILAGSADDGVNIEPTRSARSSLQYNYGDDGRSEVNLDASGNIILASCTQSTNFYTTANAIQPAKSGAQDAVLIKLNPTLTTAIFSTFFGGNGDDAAYVVNIKPDDGNIYFAGGTASTNLTGSTTGVIQPNNAGGIDGFITVIKPDGSALVQTTYLGTPQTDQIYGIQFDKFNFPYVMGLSLGNMPIINSSFGNAGSHQFISKLKKDLSGYVYSTLFGTNTTLANISPVALLVDKCENVYVSGWGGEVYTTSYPFPNSGTFGMSITPDALKSTTDGRDFYYFVLEKNGASQLFGSFFGGNQTPSQLSEHVDGGTSRFDPKGAIYQAACASCGGLQGSTIGGPGYTTTSGTFSPNNQTSSSCNLGMTKIRFNLTGVGADLRASDTMGCLPLKVDFSDQFLNAVSYEFDFGDGSPMVPTNSPTQQHTYNTTGYFKVRMIAIDLNSCNLRDTSYKFIRVRNDRATVDFNGVKQLPCLNLSYLFTNLSVPPAGKPFSANSFKWNFDDGSPILTTGAGSQLKTYANAGVYNVKLYLNDTNYCNSPDSAIKQFRLSPTVKADFTLSNGCVPFNLTIKNTSLAGAAFEWTFGDGGTSTATDPNYTYNTLGTYTIILVANDPSTCNKTDTIKKPIIVHPTPVADFSFSPFPAQINTPTQFANLSIDATIYKWKFGDGDSSSLTNPLYQFNSSNTFNVCLTASNVFGCADTICKPVISLIQPLLDIANALTPNGDGKNDMVFVRGFGIKTINWRIFNRWGQIVFETNQRNIGWDGKYKGKLQPMDSYAYTLLVELSDGQKIKKSGDITLIR